MNMEGVTIDEQGVWHKAKIDGTREVLRDDAGNPIKNSGQPLSREQHSGAASVPTPAMAPAEAETKRAA
jgi:hypothetical protein